MAPVTLEKTPRPFVVLVQDGKVIDVVPAPLTVTAAEEPDVDALTQCLDVHEIAAIDRYAAHTTVTAELARQTAIEDYAERIGVSEDVARTVYTDMRIWARALGTDGRKSWHSGGALKTWMPLKHFVLEEVMRERGELITDSLDGVLTYAEMKSIVMGEDA